MYAEKVQEMIDVLKGAEKDAVKADNGSQVAATRFRKMTLTLEKMTKAARKESLVADHMHSAE